MTLTDLKNALVSVSSSTYHYTAPDNKGFPRIVFAEDGADDLICNDVHAERIITGTIDLFSKTENDPLISATESALNGLQIGWRLNNVIYEEDTHVIHHEWVFSMYAEI